MQRQLPWYHSSQPSQPSMKPSKGLLQIQYTSDLDLSIPASSGMSTQKPSSSRAKASTSTSALAFSSPRFAFLTLLAHFLAKDICALRCLTCGTSARSCSPLTTISLQAFMETLLTTVPSGVTMASAAFTHLSVCSTSLLTFLHISSSRGYLMLSSRSLLSSENGLGALIAFFVAAAVIFVPGLPLVDLCSCAPPSPYPPFSALSTLK
mmetsp:Transcript_21533/g.42980  ORF Transcript_21533/g.42980 Transcript_21533/m.42980 type:complete len:208 (+) Transcript_21533:1639-2262(+)